LAYSVSCAPMVAALPMGALAARQTIGGDGRES